MGSKGNRAGSWLAFLALLGAAIAGILYLRRLERAEERFVPLPPSLEAVRRPVERAVDPEAASIAAVPLPTTLKEIRSMLRPAELGENRLGVADHRVAPLETHIWTLRAKVKEAEIRADNDLYLVIEEGGIGGCAELPDPKLCKGSPFQKQIEAVRAQIDKELHPSRSPLPVGRDAELTGIGYFGTAGKLDNGARLMPLLRIRWLDR
ncbi:MAG TPA: hypothetical protein VHE55_18525 [Fimbriimonadaceae bacterium]|nr:hypothetical protein [Fimbriimonadaceae bacterium]